MTDERVRRDQQKMPRQAGKGAAVKMRKLLGNLDWAQGVLQHLSPFRAIDGIDSEHIEVIRPRKQEHPPRTSRRLDKPQ